MSTDKPVTTTIRVIIWQLWRGFTNTELFRNKHHIEALNYLPEAKGLQGVVWSVVEQNPSQLVWLIEWNEMPDNLTPSLHDAQMKWNRCYNLERVPSVMISPERPELELCLYRLEEDSTFLDNAEAMKPVFDHWKEEGRPFVNAEAAPLALPVTSREEDCLMLVCWDSIDEHIAAADEEHYQTAFEAAEKTSRMLYRGHLRPVNWDDCVLYVVNVEEAKEG